MTPSEEGNASATGEDESAPIPGSGQSSADYRRSLSPKSLTEEVVKRSTVEDEVHRSQEELEFRNDSIPTPRSAAEHEESQRPSSQEPYSLNGTSRHGKPPCASKTATPHSPPESPQRDFQVQPLTSNRSHHADHNEAQSLDGTERLGRNGLPGIQQVSERDRVMHNVSDSVPTESLRKGESLKSFAPDRKVPVSRPSSAAAESTPPRQDNRASTRSTPYRDLPDHMDTATNKPKSRAGTETVDPHIPHEDNEPVGVSVPPKEPSIPVIRKASQEKLLERKRKRLRQRRNNVVIKLAKADRYSPTTRSRGPLAVKKDYMHVLFLRQALESQQTSKTDLPSLLGSTSKALLTNDWEASLHERHDCAVVKRVYEWQQRSQWSLRQPKLYPEPATPITHWDHLLGEAKWLQTDFREERKLKIATCGKLAHWCREWHEASPFQRQKLQVKADLPVSHMALVQESLPTTSTEDTVEEDDEYDLSDVDLDTIDWLDPSSKSLGASSDVSMEKGFLDRLPLFEPWKALSPHEQDTSLSADMQRMAELSQDTPLASELPPEETSCAIFDPAWKQLRARVNAHLAFKPPGNAMPPIGFYEHRRASIWTQEDDGQLRQFAKDFPSNWALIADRLTSRSLFTSSINRRTPWECYERLLSFEGATTDPNLRQWARGFQGHLDKIRFKWQSSIQQQMQAQGAPAQLQASPPRFPSPMRVERKPASRRFVAILDAARKVARRRENAENTRKQNHENQSQGARTMPPTRNESNNRSPADWSKEKFKQQEEARRRQEQFRSHRAYVQQTRAQQSNQPIYSNNIAQGVGGRPNQSIGGAPRANGHLAVPNAHNHRPQSSQQSVQLNMTSGNQTSGHLAAQLAANARQQSSASLQQRLPPQFANAQMTDPNIQQLMQQQRNQQVYQAQRQLSQGNMGHGSPNMGGVNGMSNTSMMNQFAGSNGDTMQSPRLPQGTQSGSTQTSPDMTHQLLASQFMPGRPQHPHQLSSGHVPALESLRHNISQTNPQLTENEVLTMATSQLQKSMTQNNIPQDNTVNYAQNRALNAAAGLQIPQQRPVGPQSPFLNQQSPFMQNSMAPTPMQARSDSPANMLQHQQQQYTQSMQAHVSQQMRRNGMVSPTASGNPQSSPPMGQVMPFTNGHARTPTPAQMRPPSANMTMDAQRPGSAQTHPLSAQSPRPLSSQGIP